MESNLIHLIIATFKLYNVNPMESLQSKSIQIRYSKSKGFARKSVRYMKQQQGKIASAKM